MGSPSSARASRRGGIGPQASAGTFAYRLSLACGAEEVPLVTGRAGKELFASGVLSPRGVTTRKRCEPGPGEQVGGLRLHGPGPPGGGWAQPEDRPRLNLSRSLARPVFKRSLNIQSPGFQKRQPGSQVALLSLGERARSAPLGRSSGKAGKTAGGARTPPLLLRSACPWPSGSPGSGTEGGALHRLDPSNLWLLPRTASRVGRALRTEEVVED